MAVFIRNKLAVAAVVASLGLLFVSPVKADYRNGFSGNTNMGSSAFDGTVNFAVLDTDSGAAGDTWATGFATFENAFVAGDSSPALDTGAMFLYIYQAVNNGTDDNPFSTVTVPLLVDNSKITSWGYFTDLGFEDTSGEVDAVNDFGTSGTFGNPASANTGVTSPNVVDISLTGGETPSSVLLLTTSFKTVFEDELLDGERSILFGFTSNIVPEFARGSIQDGGTPPAGDLPTPTPEPSTLLLAGLALPGVALIRRRRRRLEEQAA